MRTKQVLFFICTYCIAFFSFAQNRVPEELGILIVPKLSQPNCVRIQYEPVDVHDTPSGLKVGQLILDKPELASKNLESCENRPKLKFLPNGFNVGVDIRKILLEKGHFVIPFYAQTNINGVNWYQIKNERTYARYWIEQQAFVLPKIYATELVQGIDSLSEVCEEPGKNCGPVSFEVSKSVIKAGQQRDNCYLNAYDVKKIIEDDAGRLYYEATLALELQAAWPKLPKKITVPVYDSKNHWTGFYYQQGCAERIAID